MSWLASLELMRSRVSGTKLGDLESTTSLMKGVHETQAAMRVSPLKSFSALSPSSTQTTLTSLPVSPFWARYHRRKKL